MKKVNGFILPEFKEDHKIGCFNVNCDDVRCSECAINNYNITVLKIKLVPKKGDGGEFTKRI